MQDKIFQVTVDRDKCVGSGNCLFHAPGVFELSDDGQASVVDSDGQSRETIEFAALMCPVGAIKVEG